MFLLYFMSMHCNCCTIALFSHLGYYFIKHTSFHSTFSLRFRRSNGLEFHCLNICLIQLFGANSFGVT